MEGYNLREPGGKCQAIDAARTKIEIAFLKRLNNRMGGTEGKITSPGNDIPVQRILLFSVKVKRRGCFN